MRSLSERDHHIQTVCETHEENIMISIEASDVNMDIVLNDNKLASLHLPYHWDGKAPNKTELTSLGTLLLIWIKFKPSVDKQLQTLWSVGWHYLYIPTFSDAVNWVLECISNFIPFFTGPVIIYPCPDYFFFYFDKTGLWKILKLTGCSNPMIRWLSPQDLCI